MVNVETSTLVALCPDPIIGVDRKGIVCLFNDAAERLLGYREEDVVGQLHIGSIYTSIDHARAIKSMMVSDKGGDPGKLAGYETELLHADGRVVPIRLSASLVADEAGGGSVGFFHDLSERKRLEEKLKKQSITDELTGLYNHRHFYTTLTTEMERCSRYRHPLALICVDLDNLKLINDRLGHLEGDRILQDAAGAISESCRRIDFCFRYGGDELMVLLPQTCCDEAVVIAERIRQYFNECCVHGIDNRECGEFVASLSLGVTDTDGTEGVDHFIRRADLAMYEAKNTGGDQTVVVERDARDDALLSG